MRELWMHLVYDLLNISLPNTANSSHKPLFFLWKKSTVVSVKISEKIFPVWDLVTTAKQIEKKLILLLQKYFKTLKDRVNGTASI